MQHENFKTFIPVWFMRQAGRSLPEYRMARQDNDILEAILEPELAAELTLQPVRRYKVDAAILFSDIMVPLKIAGIGLHILPGTGPVMDRQFSADEDLQLIKPLEPERLAFMQDTIEILIRQLSVPLIGLAGGPFTMASYLIEGKPSQLHTGVKTLMREQPALWEKIMHALVQLSSSYIRFQVNAGVSAVQVFDSWIGVLSPEDYFRFAFPFAKELFATLSDLDLPLIYFGVGTSELLGLMSKTGASVLSVDWRISLRDVPSHIDSTVFSAMGVRDKPGAVCNVVQSVQGNLDPSVCLASWEVVEKAVLKTLEDAKAIHPRGYIFNLGHGVLPGTDPGILGAIVELVHGYDPQ